MHASPLCYEALRYSRIRQKDRDLMIHENTLCLNTAQRLERDFKTLLSITKGVVSRITYFVVTVVFVFNGGR